MFATTHANGLPDRSEILYPAGTVLKKLHVLNGRRRNLLKAQNRLGGQLFGYCYGYCNEDTKAAQLMHAAVLKGKTLDYDLEVEAFCRPFLNALAPLAQSQANVEKEMAAVAKALPIWTEWGKGVRGFGELSCAKIVAGTGEMTAYSNPAKVWKRLGLAVIGGERQRKVAGDAALEHGYVPLRRSDVWNVVATGMVKQIVRSVKDEEGNTVVDIFGDSVAVPISPYGEYFLQERQRQRDKLRAEKQHYRTHALNRAMRHLSKRLVRDMWVAWQDLGPVPVSG